MSFGKFLGVVAALGAAAVGYAYYKEAKAQKSELENDFAECEGDVTKAAPQKDANYTSLNANKDSFVEAAKNTFETAKGMVEPAKAMAKDIATIAKEKVEDSGVVIGDYVNDAKVNVGAFVEDAKDKFGVVEEEILNKAQNVAKTVKAEFADDEAGECACEAPCEEEVAPCCETADDSDDDEVVIQPVEPTITESFNE